VGKEIIRFHAVYWPAFLMAAGLPLPKQIWAHGWLLMDSAKMSKSLGNVVRPRPIVHVLGMDALRYYLLRETVFGQDGNFSYDALVTRYNSDLANDLGNLLSRTTTMIQRNCDSVIPKPDPDQRSALALTLEKKSADEETDIEQLLGKALEDMLGEVVRDCAANYEKLEFSLALRKVWMLVSNVNFYLVRWSPWTLSKEFEAGSGEEVAQKRRKFDTVLYNSAETLRIVACLAYPIIPEAAQKIWRQLGLQETVAEQSFADIRWGGLKPGTRLGSTESIFPRVEDKKEAIERMEAMEKEEQNAPSPVAASAPAPAAAGSSGAAAAAAPAADAKIGIEDFAKVEMRVGQIKTAERIAGADKLLKLTVDIGTEIRQICAGIAQFYEPEKLVGRKVAVVVNLAPRKLRGVESNGMIVAASVGPEGRPVLAGFPDEDVEIGARLK
jgi:methionyl-tRNA synthetase